MENQKNNIAGLISDILIAGGASIALLMGWINQALLLGISGGSGAEFTPYYYASYIITPIGLALLVVGILLSLKSLSGNKRKSAIQTSIAMVLFIFGMSLLFCDMNFDNGLKEAAKDAYLIIACKAALTFAGFFFLQKAFKSAEIQCKKIWTVITKTILLILMISSLLLFIPVVGDMFFALIFLLLGLAQMVCIYPIMTK